EALRLTAGASPKAVAIDIVLADSSLDRGADPALHDAFCTVPNLVLSCELIEDGARWEDPLPEFLRDCKPRLGHVHSQPDPSDSRTRGIPLLKRAGRQQRYALALEAFSLAHGAPITESSSDLNLQVGPAMIPVPDARFGRMRGISPEERPLRV